MCSLSAFSYVMFSPHTWRCFRVGVPHGRAGQVFSTHVEVFPQCVSAPSDCQCFLHTRGGVSKSVFTVADDAQFSPHTWRCFLLSSSPTTSTTVFSTHVEVFPCDCANSSKPLSFLHTRGGVSSVPSSNQSNPLFSPHTWRCFLLSSSPTTSTTVFSTHVEVFLALSTLNKWVSSFLHTRGGVSNGLKQIADARKFSPHTWRCFHLTLISSL